MVHCLFDHGQVLPPFRIREECRDGAFEAVNVSYLSFSLLFYCPCSPSDASFGLFLPTGLLLPCTIPDLAG